MTIWRGLVFTALVPAVVAYFLPAALAPERHRRGGIWDLGILVIAAGVLIYAVCLAQFLAAGGTPAVYFTRPLRFLIGEEPAGLVRGGLYRYSRNPMYVGVLLAVFGQAALFASRRLAMYGCVLFVVFHLVVVLLEEPHLRATQGESFDTYCREVPRWVGWK